MTTLPASIPSDGVENLMPDDQSVYSGVNHDPEPTLSRLSRAELGTSKWVSGKLISMEPPVGTGLVTVNWKVNLVSAATCADSV